MEPRPIVGACLLAIVVAACSSSQPPRASASAAATATAAVAEVSPSASAAASSTPGASATPTAPPTPVPPVPPNTGVGPVRLQRAMGGLAFAQMTGAFQGPDGRWYVLEQAGRILTFREGDATATVFLDVRDHVESGGEKGLLGFAFAPDFERSGVFFVDYTQGGPLRTHISSFISRGTTADKGSEAVLLEIAQPFDNHNGGQLAVGPDGYLYIGLGDGGSGGDPQRNGQNTSALLAKILRIDVSDRTRYRIPPDNPFAGGGGRGEVWAYGLRNPWRFSFDAATGVMYIADVGQNLYEEIDVGVRGANYGWNVMEGTHCYNAARCNTAGLTLPIAEYGHDLGCSVTGGYVLRGTAPELRGMYLYGDYCSGRIWGLRYVDGQVRAQGLIATSGFPISSFAQDRAGDVYVLQYTGAGGIYKIVP